MSNRLGAGARERGKAGRRHCKVFRLAGTVAVSLLLPALACSGLAAQSAQLPRKAARQLDSLLESPPFDRNLWGVALVDAKGRLLYGKNADKLFIPASNTKLLVAAVGAARFDPGFSVATSAYGTAPMVNGVLAGDLILYGRGDPTFGKRCYATDTTLAGVCDRDPFSHLRELAQALRSQGLRVVQGNLVGDGSWFDGELVNAAWGNYDLNWWYAAPVSGLGFNDNSVDITWKPGPELDAPALLSLTPDLGDVTLENRTRTVGPGGVSDIGDRMYRVPGTLNLWAEGTVAADGKGGLESFALPDPSLFTARAFRQVLTEAGIAVLGPTTSTTDSLRYQAARAGSPLAEVRGRPMRDWIFPILNTSQNWYADMLLKQLGRQFGSGGTWDGGVEVVRRFLVDSIRVDSTMFATVDGSGLAASNLVAPLAFTRLLQFIRRHPHWDAFAAGLPQSGNAGSLKNRFLGTPIEGKVWAKTGSISRVNTLSGYFTLQDGREFTFSVQMNHGTLGGRRTIAQIDSVVVAMARAVSKR